MVFCFNYGHQLAISTEKFYSNCDHKLSDRKSGDSINISGNQWDVFGVGFLGSGNKQRLNELTKVIESITPGQEDEIDYEKQKNIEGKTATLSKEY